MTTSDEQTPQPMVMRTLRVPLPLWDEAMAAAAESEDSISNVVRTALALYVKRQRRAKR